MYRCGHPESSGSHPRTDARRRGSPATLDCTGRPEVRINAVDSALLWGWVCFVGEGNTTTIDVSPQIIHKHFTIGSSWTFSFNGLAEVAKFVVDRQVSLKELFTHRFTLDEADEASTQFNAGGTGKVCFNWD